MSSFRTASRLVMAIATVGVIAGCGSTVELGARGTDPSLLGDSGMTLTTPSATQGTSAGEGTGEGLQAGPGDSTASGSPSAGSSAGPYGALATAPSSIGGGLAASTKPIVVGVVTANTAAIAAVFGQKPTDDPNQPVQNMFTYINKHGGILGRQIKPLFGQVSSSSDADTAGQTLCAKFTQDNHVDIVLNNVLFSDPLVACLQKKNVAMFGSVSAISNGKYLADRPNLFTPDNLAIDRYAGVMVDEAVKRGGLKRGDKLGVFIEDCPDINANYNAVIVPAAKRAGVTLFKQTTKCVTNLVGDLAGITTDIQRTVLVFKAAGVADVMAPTGVEAYIISMFTQTANGQNYYPHYEISSNALPENDSNQGNVIHYDKSALPKISGVGYLPLQDVGKRAVFSKAQLAKQAQCRAADPTIGGTFGKDTSASSSSFKFNLFYTNCDVLFAMHDVLVLDQVRLGIADIAQAYPTFLKKAVSTVGAGGGFYNLVGRHDGLGTAQSFTWNVAAGRFDYVGPSLRL